MRMTPKVLGTHLAVLDGMKEAQRDGEDEADDQRTLCLDRQVNQKDATLDCEEEHAGSS